MMPAIGPSSAPIALVGPGSYSIDWPRTKHRD